MAKAKKKESTLTLEEKLAQALVPECEQPYKVPKNWCWTRVRVVSEIISKGTTPVGGKSAYVSEGIPFLRVENLNDDGTISHDSIVYISETTHIGMLKRSILHKGDVLVSIAGTLGKTGIVRDVDLPMNANQAVAFIRLYSDVAKPEYVRFLFDSPVLNNLLVSKTKVTSIPNLTLDIIGSSMLPLPPLAEQQRIVERVESLFAKLDEAKEKLQEILDSFETRKATILHKAFTGELTAKWREENGAISEWCCCEIKDIFELQAGKNISATLISKNQNDKNLYPCFGGNGIRGYVEYFNREGNHPIIGRQGALCGNVNLASGKFYATEHAVVVSFKQKTDIVWAEHYLRFLNFNQYATSTAQPGLAVSNLMKVSINVPLYEEQIEIGKIIVETFTREERVKLIAEESLEQIETMKKAILARAFRGELGTNDENDESAVELLKRVL